MARRNSGLCHVSIRGGCKEADRGSWPTLLDSDICAVVRIPGCKIFLGHLEITVSIDEAAQVGENFANAHDGPNMSAPLESIDYSYHTCPGWYGQP